MGAGFAHLHLMATTQVMRGFQIQLHLVTGAVLDTIKRRANGRSMFLQASNATSPEAETGYRPEGMKAYQIG